MTDRTDAVQRDSDQSKRANSHAWSRWGISEGTTRDKSCEYSGRLAYINAQGGRDTNRISWLVCVKRRSSLCLRNNLHNRSSDADPPARGIHANFQLPFVSNCR